MELVKKIAGIGLKFVENPVESVYNCLYNLLFTKNIPVKYTFGGFTKVSSQKSLQSGGFILTEKKTVLSAVLFWRAL